MCDKIGVILDFVSLTGDVYGSSPGEINEDFEISDADDQTIVSVSDATTTRPGDPFHLLDDVDVIGGQDEDALGAAGDSPIDATVIGTTGATYDLRFYGQDDTQYSPPSGPVKVTLPGTLPPTLSLQSDKATPGKLTWTPPSGISSGTVRFYKIGRANGQETAIPIGGYVNIADGQTTLPASAGTGELEVFAVYSGVSTDYTIHGTSDYSNRVKVEMPGNAPAAPVIVDGVYDPSVPGGQVKLAWTNISANEKEYKIYRLNSAGSYDLIKSNRADDTTSTEAASKDPWPWTYKVVASNAAGDSAGAIVHVFPIGGPDITGHHLAVRQAVLSKINSLPPSAGCTARS